MDIITYCSPHANQTDNILWRTRLPLLLNPATVIYLLLIPLRTPSLNTKSLNFQDVFSVLWNRLPGSQWQQYAIVLSHMNGYADTSQLSPGAESFSSSMIKLYLRQRTTFVSSQLVNKAMALPVRNFTVWLPDLWHRVETSPEEM